MGSSPAQFEPGRASPLGWLNISTPPIPIPWPSKASRTRRGQLIASEIQCRLAPLQAQIWPLLPRPKVAIRLNAARNMAKLDTQPDPSYAADAMRYDRMNQLSADLNRNFQGIAAGFGTAQQQASKQAALGAGGGGVGDSLGALAKIQAMQDQTVQDNQKARFYGQPCRDCSPKPCRRNSGDPQVRRGSHGDYEQPRCDEVVHDCGGGERDHDGYAKGRRGCDPGMGRRQPEGHAAADRRLQGQFDRRRNGRERFRATAVSSGAVDLPSLLDKGPASPIIRPGKLRMRRRQRRRLTQAKQTRRSLKDSAAQDYTAVHSKLTDIQQYIDTLNKDPAAAQQAMATMSYRRPASGRVLDAGNALVSPERQGDAAVALQKVQSDALTSESLSNVKNVRNVSVSLTRSVKRRRRG